MLQIDNSEKSQGKNEENEDCGSCFRRGRQLCSTTAA